jgi:ABC-type siderophore export system fused ATPase/permease subunit
MASCPDPTSFQADLPRLFAVYSRQWIVFSLIRVGTFAAVLAILMTLGVNVFIAAIGAAVIGFCVSYIFLRKQREAVSSSIGHLRARKDRDTDNELENEALDRFEEPR